MSRPMSRSQDAIYRIVYEHKRQKLRNQGEYKSFKTNGLTGKGERGKTVNEGRDTRGCRFGRCVTFVK